MRTIVRIASVVLVAAVVSVCSDDDDGPTGMTGPFTLTFRGDASFNTPHGDDPIYVALVQTSTGEVIERRQGTVSATANPAFDFTFTDLLEEGTAYEVHYWIDSNFGGGTEGACDPIANDHQWNVAVAATTLDVTITEMHDAAATESACATFAVDLTFAGDASFQGPHPDQAIYVAVVRASDGAVVARQTGTVSATADPAFSFSLPGALLIGVAYEIHYWIDSNFGGGTEGVCDPMANDHQWSIAVAAPTQDVTVTEVHDASALSDVCDSFTASLTFAGDASFQTPHPDHPIAVAVVRASDGAVMATQSGTVSGTADPAFSFSFPGVLLIGVAYEVHYWIDSNFVMGTDGVCDPPANDHQWSVPVPTVTADVSITEMHNAAATEDVCASFP